MPSSEEVDEILAQPAPPESDVFADVGQTIEHWKLADPPSTTGVEAYEGDNRGAQVLAENVGARATAGMTCVARQLAEFLDLHGALPSVALQEFVLARCGSMVGQQSLEVRPFVVDPGRRRLDAAALRLTLESAIQGRLASSRADSWLGGAWYTGDGNGGLLLVAEGRRALGLESVPMNLAGRTHVRISGKLPSKTEGIMAFITTGDDGVARCERVADPLGGADRFTLSCPVRSTDPFAMIDVIELKRRRLLGSKVVTLYVSPDGSLPATYEMHEYPGIEGSGGLDPATLALAINQLRDQAQLPPFLLDEGQSTESSQLMPHYLAASRDPARAELADTIALAFLSGRKVGTVVRGAGFLHFTVGAEDAASVARMLARQNLSPMIRSRLLDPKAQSLAVGIQRNDATGAVAVVISTYEHPNPGANAELEAELYDALNVARGSRGRSRVRRYNDQFTNAVMDQSMGRLEVGFTPNYQGPVAQHRLAEIHRRPFGFAFLVLSGHGLADLEWPLQLLDLEETNVALRVGYYRPNGTNWAHELVFIVYS